MTPIVESVEIARRPEDVFAYVTDPAHFGEWQEGLVSVRPESEAPFAVGSRLTMIRRLGRSERTMTMELTELSPPRRWAARGVDGPARAILEGTVEPLDDGERSRVTIRLDFVGHGIGKLLVPIFVLPQARAEMPKNQQKLKQVLESNP